MEALADGADIGVVVEKEPHCLSNDIENLVFRGGGMKGLAYCGALNVMMTINKLDHVKRYAGASAGAIIAALLCIGYTPEELEVILKKQDFKLFKDAEGLLDRASQLYKTYGLYKGKVFYEWIGKLIYEKTGSPDTTFEQIFTRFNKEVVVVGTCITHTEVHYFSVHTTPAMPLRDAVRISMSIPLFFEPVTLEDHIFVDGGVTDNFPLSVFDTETYDYEHSYRAPVNTKTLGFFLMEDKRHPHTRKVTGIKSYVGCMMDTVKQRIAFLALKPGDELRTLFIQTRYITSTQFNISDQEKDLLYHEGQSAARRFFRLKKADSPDLSVGGRLIVKLIEGANLKDNILPDDPYCVFTHEGDSRKSRIKYKTVNPVWNEIFVFKVADINKPLKLQVFDYEFLRPPKVLGVQEIPITSMVVGGATDLWVHLEHGKVHLELTWSHAY